MERINEEKFKELCKKRPFCYLPPLSKALSDYANTPEYLRRLIEHKARKGYVKIEDVEKIFKKVTEHKYYKMKERELLLEEFETLIKENKG